MGELSASVSSAYSINSVPSQQIAAFVNRNSGRHVGVLFEVDQLQNPQTNTPWAVRS